MKRFSVLNSLWKVNNGFLTPNPNDWRQPGKPDPFVPKLNVLDSKFISCAKYDQWTVNCLSSFKQSIVIVGNNNSIWTKNWKKNVQNDTEITGRTRWFSDVAIVALLLQDKTVKFHKHFARTCCSPRWIHQVLLFYNRLPFVWLPTEHPFWRKV